MFAGSALAKYSAAGEHPCMDAGMTLLEALVVLVLAGAMTAAIGTSLFPDLAKRDVAAAASAFRSIASFAQVEAIRNGRPVLLGVDQESAELRVVEPRRVERLPRSVAIKLISAAELVEGDIPRVAFFPDGSATGATIAFKSGAHRETLRLNWVTGRIDDARPGS